MTMYAKCQAKDLWDTEYLTAGRLYPVVENRGIGFDIASDALHALRCLWEGCAHLSGGDWEMVEQ